MSPLNTENIPEGGTISLFLNKKFVMALARSLADPVNKFAGRFCGLERAFRAELRRQSRFVRKKVAVHSFCWERKLIKAMPRKESSQLFSFCLYVKKFLIVLGG